TRAITRMRMSAEYAFGMARPPDESMPPDSPIYRSLGILRFYSARTCSRRTFSEGRRRSRQPVECHKPRQSPAPGFGEKYWSLSGSPSHSLVSVRKHFESFESFVIQRGDLIREGHHRCGRRRTADVTTAANCDIRVT